MNNDPQNVTDAEWEEIIKVPKVREDWGLETETAGVFRDMVYAAKFDFVSGSPGYRGELFVITGNALSAAPMILIRESGQLIAVNDF